MQNGLKPSLTPVIANYFLGYDLKGDFQLKVFCHWERSIFLYCGALSVPVWSATSNCVHLGVPRVSLWSGTNYFLHLLQLGTCIARKLTGFYMTGTI